MTNRLVLALIVAATTLAAVPAEAGYCVGPTTVRVLTHSVTVSKTCIPPE